MNDYHKPVLLSEVLEYLQVQSGKKYIDATLGGGGHAAATLEQGGVVLGIDQDEDALNYVQENHKPQITNHKLTVIKGNFKDLKQIAKENGFTQVDGILFDLGVSSHQFDTPERGFSFKEDGPLDMRMDKNQAISAKDIIAVLNKKELEELFRRLGEEHNARRIAERIAEVRKQTQITTTKQLADIVAGRSGGFYSRQRRASPKAGIHPATKVFQALRIAVNDELNVIGQALPQALELLQDGGRIAVISFHSLEDRIIKHMFLDWQKTGKGNVLTKKPIEATEAEQKENRRSRSAKLRVFQKGEIYA